MSDDKALVVLKPIWTPKGEIAVGTVGLKSSGTDPAFYYFKIRDDYIQGFSEATMLEKPDIFSQIQPPPKPEKTPSGYEYTGRLLHKPMGIDGLTWTLGVSVFSGAGVHASELDYNGWRWEVRKTNPIPPNSKPCKCDICAKWSPLFNRIMPLLTPEDRVLLDEFRTNEMMESLDLGVAQAKLDGIWPGWEWMKDAKVKIDIEPAQDKPAYVYWKAKYEALYADYDNLLQAIANSQQARWNAVTSNDSGGM